MKNVLSITTLVAILNASSAFAATGFESSDFSLIGWIFFGFLALIVTLQFIPAIMMFGSMMVGIFSKGKEHEEITSV